VCSGNATGPSAAACYGVILTAIETMLDAIYKALPLVQVGIMGYDFTNFVATTECQAQGLLDFHGLDQQGINEVFLGYGTHVLAPLTQKYNALQFQFVPVWGTLQVCAGCFGFLYAGLVLGGGAWQCGKNPLSPSRQLPRMCIRTSPPRLTTTRPAPAECRRALPHAAPLPERGVPFAIQVHERWVHPLQC
jgi:hypothetical protein